MSQAFISDFPSLIYSVRRCWTRYALLKRYESDPISAAETARSEWTKARQDIYTGVIDDALYGFRSGLDHSHPDVAGLLRLYRNELLTLDVWPELTSTPSWRKICCLVLGVVIDDASFDALECEITARQDEGLRYTIADFAKGRLFSFKTEEEMKYYSVERNDEFEPFTGPRDSVEPRYGDGLRNTNETHHGRIRLTDEVVTDGKMRMSDEPITRGGLRRDTDELVQSNTRFSPASVDPQPQ